jgi:HPt (histidine-containing phosphotransfer) domain-containing protein
MSQHAGETSISPVIAAPPTPLEPLLDRATISQLRDTLTSEMREQLLDIFDAQREKCVADLVAAVRRGDRMEIRRIAHMLKGSSASLGASALRSSCEALERVCRPGDAEVPQSQVEELRVAAAAVSDALRQHLI